MKILYGARFLRYDLLWPLASVARQISKWNKASDRRLHRLVSYLNTTIEYSLESFVGDDPERCIVLEYCDASFADDIRESKSTSGCYLAIAGPHTFVSVTSFSKRQGAVSHSSTEAEIISLEEAVRSEGLSVLTFWEHVVLLFGEHRRTRQSGKKQHWYVELNSQPAQTSMCTSGLDSPASTIPGAPTGGDRRISAPSYFPKFGDAELLREMSTLGTLRLEHVENFYLARQYCPQVKFVVAEDNEAVIKIIKKGRSTKLRHIHRTH